ncbi:hypothetical protein BDY19DRAFT_923179 [Irpex rosettiformis]|uniref:Uncharacterized protein n=1 Tax=Irpex rosettiformis TaxID=378272 RepID=A0ACB8UG30_9APHY|nr:hypothetical protein BDY19DRAFT_923179 [Irpex rosettiformis]
MSDIPLGGDRAYGYGTYDQGGSERYENQFRHPQYSSPPQRRATMPVPDVGGFIDTPYAMPYDDSTVPFHPQPTSQPSSAWPQSGVSWHPQGDYESFPGGNHGRGLVGAPEEALQMPMAPPYAHGPPPGPGTHSYTYHHPQPPDHAATMPPSETGRFPPSSPATGGFGRTFYTSEPQSNIPYTPNASYHSPQEYGYPSGTVEGPFQPGYSHHPSHPSRSTTLGATLLNAGLSYFGMQVDDGDPRAGQAQTHSGQHSMTKPKPVKPSTSQQRQQNLPGQTQYVPAHQTLPPRQRTL